MSTEGGGAGAKRRTGPPPPSGRSPGDPPRADDFAGIGQAIEQNRREREKSAEGNPYRNFSADPPPLMQEQIRRDAQARKARERGPKTSSAGCAGSGCRRRPTSVTTSDAPRPAPASVPISALPNHTSLPQYVRANFNDPRRQV